MRHRALGFWHSLPLPPAFLSHRCISINAGMSGYRPDNTDTSLK